MHGLPKKRTANREGGVKRGKTNTFNSPPADEVVPWRGGSSDHHEWRERSRGEGGFRGLGLVNQKIR